jgi:CubicO group peptidase (beta-lactamase class C family)
MGKSEPTAVSRHPGFAPQKNRLSRPKGTIASIQAMTNWRIGLLTTAAAASLTLSTTAQQLPAGAPASRPTDNFADARRALAALPRLHSILVSARGSLVFEQHAKGYSATRAANVKSASKSVISALVGIAIDRQLIKGTDQPIADFFPELRRDKDARKPSITLGDLLTMRAGLESTSGPNYGRWVLSRNWVSHALARPMVAEPGTTMIYSTGTSHVLSAILTKATRSSTWEFARTRLGPVLGGALAQWPRDPQGIYFGGNDMLLTPRQMLALGQLYLAEGRWDGKQIVPASWVRESCVPRTTSRFDPGREYGYGWWIDDIGDYRACYAWGFGGQFILVVPELNAVIAIASSTEVSDERRGYRRELLSIIERLVLPRIGDGS